MALGPVLFKSTLSSNLMQTNSAQWSDNDSFLIITAAGINIFSMEGHVQDDGRRSNSIAFDKTFIPNPNETFKMVTRISTDEVIEACTKEEEYLIYLDHTLYTDTSNAPTFRSFKYALWSPHSKHYSCILATLTLDHRLTLMIKEKDEWTSFACISNLLNDRMNQEDELVNRQDMDINYSFYKEIMYHRSITIICWSEIFNVSDDVEVCFLIAGSKSGYITFWRLTFTKESIEVHFAGEWCTGMGQLYVMSIFESYLCIGTHSGQLMLIKIDFKTNSMDTITTTFSPRLMLWAQKDELSINHLKLTRIDSKQFLVIYTKLTFIMVAVVQEITLARQQLMKIKKESYQEALYKMPSTDICIIEDKKFIISSGDGSLIQVTLEDDYSIKQSELQMNDIIRKQMIIHGLSSSRNRTLLCLVQHIAAYFDHLNIKEPVQVYIIAALPDKKFYEKFEQIIDGVDDQFSELPEISDYLICYRGYLNTGSDYLPVIIRKYMNTLNDVIFSHFKPFQLKILRSITSNLCKLNKDKFNPDEITILKDLLLKIETIILRHYCEKIIEDVINHNSELTEMQKLSLNNMCIWLKENCQLSYGLDIENIIEVCPICRMTIPFSERSHGCCPNGHRFARCTSSLLICDISIHEYNRCKICKENFVIIPPIWGIYHKTCVFC